MKDNTKGGFYKWLKKLEDKDKKSNNHKIIVLDHLLLLLKKLSLASLNFEQLQQ